MILINLWELHGRTDKPKSYSDQPNHLTCNGAEMNLEENKLLTEKRISGQRFQNHVENVRAANTAGANAIKTAFLLNGGAAVALLAFLSSLSSIDGVIPAHFASSLMAFGRGTVMVASASGFVYLALFAGTRKTEVFHIFNVIAITLVIGSYLFFLYGLQEVSKSFS